MKKAKEERFLGELHALFVGTAEEFARLLHS